MQIIIYVFSILFSLIVVHMVCSKAFIQERTDIGIFKATGFKTSGLRRQFAFRFLIISIIGSAIGGILSCLFSGKMLEVLLKSTDVTSVNTNLFFLIICDTDSHSMSEFLGIFLSRFRQDKKRENKRTCGRIKNSRFQKKLAVFLAYDRLNMYDHYGRFTVVYCFLWQPPNSFHQKKLLVNSLFHFLSEI